MALGREAILGRSSVPQLSEGEQQCVNSGTIHIHVIIYDHNHIPRLLERLNRSVDGTTEPEIQPK